MTEKIICYALMSFDGKYDFVYEAINKAAQKFSEKNGVDIHIERADEYLVTRQNKIEEIKEKIRNSDFCIIDFSELAPSVMWEFGFCQCLNKNIIPLTCSKEPIPFNIQGTDYCTYRLSRKGVDILIGDLQSHFSSVFTRIREDRNYLFYDDRILQMFGQVNSHLKDMRNNSLTKELVYYEFERLARRISGLRDGRFDLRKEKPITEIIECYCDYLEQLEGAESEFLAVTCSDFWKEISELGHNSQYIEANKNALKKGAKIKRVFIFNEKQAEYYNKAFNNIIKKIMDEHLDLVDAYGRDQVQVKVIEVEKPENLKKYENFGILKKSNELLLFQPEYNVDNEMIITHFTHSIRNESSEIARKLKNFDSVFASGIWLEDLKINAKVI